MLLKICVWIHDATWSDSFYYLAEWRCFIIDHKIPSRSGKHSTPGRTTSICVIVKDLWYITLALHGCWTIQLVLWGYIHTLNASSSVHNYQWIIISALASVCQHHFWYPWTILFSKMYHLFGLSGTSSYAVFVYFVFVFFAFARLTHGNIIFDILEQSSFQKYITCWVFLALCHMLYLCIYVFVFLYLWVWHMGM